MRKGAVLLFRDGLCYQSYGWNLLRPLGDIQNAVNHLDSYNVDEIAIIRPVRKDDTKSSFLADIEELKRLKSSSPLSFGGGIRDFQSLSYLQGLPFERYLFSSALYYEDSSIIQQAIQLFGQQAVVGFLPFRYDLVASFFNSQKGIFLPSKMINRESFKSCDEVVLYDCESEGKKSGFHLEVLRELDIDISKCVLSGGISDDFERLNTLDKRPSGILIENSVLHSEFSIKR
jgi:phosphoribosylformimino-5-aminoimidazole carboxamide ribonucleotide (ProFAR) isomerase